MRARINMAWSKQKDFTGTIYHKNMHICICIFVGRQCGPMITAFAFRSRDLGSRHVLGTG